MPTQTLRPPSEEELAYIAENLTDFDKKIGLRPEHYGIDPETERPILRPEFEQFSRPASPTKSFVKALVRGAANLPGDILEVGGNLTSDEALTKEDFQRRADNPSLSTFIDDLMHPGRVFPGMARNPEMEKLGTRWKEKVNELIPADPRNPWAERIGGIIGGLAVPIGGEIGLAAKAARTGKATSAIAKQLPLALQMIQDANATREMALEAGKSPEEANRAMAGYLPVALAIMGKLGPLGTVGRALAGKVGHLGGEILRGGATGGLTEIAREGLARDGDISPEQVAEAAAGYAAGGSLAHVAGRMFSPTRAAEEAAAKKAKLEKQGISTGETATSSQEKPKQDIAQLVQRAVDQEQMSPAHAEEILSNLDPQGAYSRRLEINAALRAQDEGTEYKVAGDIRPVDKVINGLLKKEIPLTEERLHKLHDAAAEGADEGQLGELARQISLEDMAQPRGSRIKTIAQVKKITGEIQELDAKRRELLSQADDLDKTATEELAKLNPTAESSKHWQRVHETSKAVAKTYREQAEQISNQIEVLTADLPTQTQENIWRGAGMSQAENMRLPSDEAAKPAPAAGPELMTAEQAEAQGGETIASRAEAEAQAIGEPARAQAAAAALQEAAARTVARPPEVEPKTFAERIAKIEAEKRALEQPAAQPHPDVEAYMRGEEIPGEKESAEPPLQQLLEGEQSRPFSGEDSGPEKVYSGLPVNEKSVEQLMEKLGRAFGPSFRVQQGTQNPDMFHVTDRNTGKVVSYELSAKNDSLARVAGPNPSRLPEKISDIQFGLLDDAGKNTYSVAADEARQDFLSGKRNDISNVLAEMFAGKLAGRDFYEGTEVRDNPMADGVPVRGYFNPATGERISLPRALSTAGHENLHAVFHYQAADVVATHLSRFLEYRPEATLKAAEKIADALVARGSSYEWLRQQVDKTKGYFKNIQEGLKTLEAIRKNAENLGDKFSTEYFQRLLERDQEYLKGNKLQFQAARLADIVDEGIATAYSDAHRGYEAPGAKDIVDSLKKLGIDMDKINAAMELPAVAPRWSENQQKYYGVFGPTSEMMKSVGEFLNKHPLGKVVNIPRAIFAVSQSKAAALRASGAHLAFAAGKFDQLFPVRDSVEAAGMKRIAEMETQYDKEFKDSRLVDWINKTATDETQPDFSKLPAELQPAARAYRKLVEDWVTETNAEGIKVESWQDGKKVFRKMLKRDGYAVTSIDRAVWEAMEAGGEQWEKFKQDFLDHWKKKTGGTYGGEEALADTTGSFNYTRLSAGQPLFKALRFEHGVGLPESWRSRDVLGSLKQYNAKRAQDIAWTRVVQDNPAMRRLLGIKQDKAGRFTGVEDAKYKPSPADIELALREGEKVGADWVDGFDPAKPWNATLAGNGPMAVGLYANYTRRPTNPATILTKVGNASNAAASALLMAHSSQFRNITQAMGNALTYGMSDWNSGRAAMKGLVESIASPLQAVRTAREAGAVPYDITAQETGSALVDGVTRATNDILRTKTGINWMASYAKAVAHHMTMAVLEHQARVVGVENSPLVREFGPVDQIGKLSAQEVLAQTAATITNHIDPAYDIRSLPNAMVPQTRNFAGQMARLMTWGTAAYNNWYTDKYIPALNGHPERLLKGLFISTLGAAGVQALFSALKGQLPATLTVQEWLGLNDDKKKETAAPLVFGLLQQQGELGILGDILAGGWDLAQGKTPRQDYTRPMLPALMLANDAGATVKDWLNYVRLEKGSVDLADFGHLAIELAKLHQTGRDILNRGDSYLGDRLQRQALDQAGRREIRMFQELTGRSAKTLELTNPGLISDFKGRPKRFGLGKELDLATVEQAREMAPVLAAAADRGVTVNARNPRMSNAFYNEVAARRGQSVADEIIANDRQRISELPLKQQLASMMKLRARMAGRRAAFSNPED